MRAAVLGHTELDMTSGRLSRYTEHDEKGPKEEIKKLPEKTESSGV